MDTNTLLSCPTTPPHCPNPKCKYHNHQTGPWPYVRFGSFRRRTPPHVIQRYRCRACGRTFCDQTFSTSYWLKRPQLLPKVFKLATTGAANRQLARAIGASPATVDNLLGRLGRHCLLFHRQVLAQASPPEDTSVRDVALDGLVTFEYSQYLPYEIVAAVDRRSSFIRHFAEAERRRSGTMTVHQKQRRALIERTCGRPDPRSLFQAVLEVTTEALKGALSAQIYTDKHKVYPQVFAQVPCAIEHHQIDSRQARTARNPLFEVNVLDMMLRHCLKDHTRETIAFGKRRAASMYRVAIYLVWRNYIKLRRERRCRQTPAMVEGLLERRLTEMDVLARRLFVGHVTLPRLWEAYYWKRVETRVLKVNRLHDLTYAT